MTHVNSNNVGVQVNRESSAGTAGTLWKKLQVNGKPDVHGKPVKIKRSPLEKERNQRKGTTVDIDSAAKLSMDITWDAIREFVEAGYFASMQGATQFVGATAPTAVTSTGYTVASGGAITAGWLAMARGFAKAANNGLKLIGSSSTGTEVKTSGLTAEAAIPAAQEASLEVCGVRGAGDDITCTATTILSTTLDFTTLPLYPGMYIWVGGATANSFATAACRGLRRISTIATHTITCDRDQNTWVTDAGTGKAIDIYFGPFLCNVAIDAGTWLERSYNLEVAFPNLGGPGTDGYLYGNGQYVDKMTIDMPLTGKGTMDLDFVGFDTPAPTTSRKSGASTGRVVVTQEMMNTSSEMIAIRLTDTSGTAITAGFVSAKAMMMNHLKGQRALGTTGAQFMNIGKQEVSVDVQAFFDSVSTLAAARDNTDVAFSCGMRSKLNLAGFFFDVPIAELDGGDLDIPENETVLQSLTVLPYKDPVLGYQSSLSLFPYLPAA